MIEFKKVKNIQIDGADPDVGFRSTAFGVYLNLLEQFTSRELFLLESMGPSSIDTRASLIGINPVLNIEVFDHIITIAGNQQLLKKIELIYSEELLVDSSAYTLRYQLTSRNAIWDFLRLLDAQFKTVEEGVLAFSAFSYNTIHFIEDISGYIQGDIPDIYFTCYSTYVEFEDDRVTLHEYGFTGAKCIGLPEIISCLSLNVMTPGVFVHS